MRSALLAALVAVGALAADQPSTAASSKPAVIYENDFTHGLADFVIEAEQPASVTTKDGVLMLDAPAGLTVWLKQRLSGPTVIEYDARVVSDGGANDRVSDLNCFWMAADPGKPDQLPGPRSGKFADYDTLRTYYVGYGGNANTTTRFRRYIGQPGNRPLRPQDEFKDAAHLLVANQSVHIKLVADGRRIEFWRDGERLFELDDPEPYRDGYFGFRTVKSRLEIRNLLITTP